MLKIFKGHNQPPTIINTERIKFAQCKSLKDSINLFMNEGFSGENATKKAGIVLLVDYDGKKYNSEAEVIENFLNFLNGPDTTTDEFGIYPIERVF